MQDAVLRLIETAGPPQRAWRSELWWGFPGAAGAEKLTNRTDTFTEIELEAPSGGVALDKKTVLRAIQREDQPDPVFLAIGQRLHELLERCSTGTAWREARDRAAVGADPGLRTYLELPSPLDEWPWELLAFPVRPGVFPRAFNSVQHPVVRLAAPFDPTLAWPDQTVRILLVSGQEKLDANNLASTELRAIRRIFHNANLSVLVDLCEAPPDPPTLKARIAAVAPHVLHFIGHGRLQPGGDFVLSFSRNAASWEWSANQISQFLVNLSTQPRVVVLNSCHSSQDTPTAAPVAALLNAGVRAVVGANATFQIDYARAFAEAFYGALAKQQPLDRAMATAREMLTDIANYAGLDRRHWALPVLTVNSPVQHIVGFKRATTVLAQCEIAREVFTRPGTFVDRITDRWSMLSAFSPPDPRATPFRGVIVTGASPKVGKSWAIKRVIRDFIDGDFIVRYATLVDAIERDSLDVLHDWRGRPNRNTPLQAPPIGQHFDEFDRTLAAARADPTAKNKDDVFRAFKAGLQGLRNGRRVLLVLARLRENGQPSVSSADFREHLLEKLLLPIAATPADPEVDGVYSLLMVRYHDNVPTGQQLDDFDEFALARVSAQLPEGTRTPADGFRRLTVGEFAADDVDRHFDEFADFTSNASTDALRAYMRTLALQKTWSPLRLQEIELPMRNALKL